MDEPPFVFPGERIGIAAPQETDVVGVFQLLDRSWIGLKFPEIELDGALILLAALDEQLFAVALGLEGNAGQLHIEHECYGRGHGEKQQENVTLFAGVDSASARPGTGAISSHSGIRTLHPADSSASGRVCVLLSWVSSTTAELMPMRTTLYRRFTTSPSAATKMSSPSRKKARLCPSIRCAV